MLSSLATLFAVAAGVLAGAEAGERSSLIDDSALQDAGLVRYWEAHLPLSGSSNSTPDGDSLSAGYVIDEALYVTTRGGAVFALEANTGLIRWAQKLVPPDFTIYHPAHIRTADGAGPVIIPTTTRVFVFERFSGDLLRSFSPTFAPGSAAVGYDHSIFMGSSGGRFYSLQFDHPQAKEPFIRWEVNAAAPITATPLLFGRDNLIFASGSGAVYSCQGRDKSLNWAFRTGGPVRADPAADESGVYVASTDRSLYKLNHINGQMLWRVRFPSPLEQGPVLAAQTVYQYGSGRGLCAIDAATGQEKWCKPEGVAFAAHAPGGDTIFTADRKLLIVDPESGELRHSIDTPAVVKTIPNPYSDALYLLGHNGQVLCARIETIPYLKRQQIISARRGLNLTPSQRTDGSRPSEGEKAVAGKSTKDDPLRSRRDVNP